LDLLAALKDSRENFLDRHQSAGDWRLWGFSGLTLALWRAARTRTSLARGLTLDAGSGRGAWRDFLRTRGVDYESIDLAPRGGDRPTWIGDVMEMTHVPGERYDSVVSHQVLEHVPRPWRAVAEFHRVLRPGGLLIVSVPHLSRRHELPHDYFRFTQEGLAALLRDAGFEEIEVISAGGLICFLHHQVSCVFPGFISSVPIVGTALAFLNLPLSWLAFWLDCLFDRAALAPAAVIATAKRPEGVPSRRR